MSDHNQEFFEQLAGIKYDDEEFEPQLVKATSTKTSKKTKEDQIDEDQPLNIVAHDSDEGLDPDDDVEGHLTVDVYQDDDNIIIESTIAGVDPDDVDVSITPESVSIIGTRVREEKVKKESYLHQECFWGKFSRSVILPQEIDPEKAQAALKNGVLKIVLPKIQRSKSKKVKVKLD